VSPLPDTSLAEVAERAWALLARGAADKRHGFNAFQVATLGAQGWPESRTVVLRAVTPSTRRVTFHTDRRSAKAAQIEADGRVSAVFWSTKDKLQLRLWGQAGLLRDQGAVAEIWEGLSPAQKAIYRAEPPPGRTVPDPALLDGEADGTPDAFAVVQITVMRFEWLHLRAEGHRRARFDWADGWQGSWLAP
jgi:hypothetical protein